jgi:hypothetical protein
MADHLTTASEKNGKRGGQRANWPSHQTSTPAVGRKTAKKLTMSRPKVMMVVRRLSLAGFACSLFVRNWASFNP